jgi:hypothetical protein
MPRWTQEARQKQSELIQNWQPWKTAGVKTPEGKAISSQNALKKGLYTPERKAYHKEQGRIIREAWKDIQYAHKAYLKWIRRLERKEKRSQSC